MHAHLNLPVNVCSLVMKTRQGLYVDDNDVAHDVVMIDFYVADER
jgi:hypothetical protein